MKDLPRGRNREKLDHSRAAAAGIATLKANEKRDTSWGLIFVLSSSFSVFARRDSGEQHDPGRRLSGSILTQGRFERQFSVSDLG